MLTPHGWLKNPLVEVAPDGEILRIESLREPDRSPSTEFYAGILIPGFVNAHCHLELSYLQGAIPEGGGFAAFARSMGEVRHRATIEERLAAARVSDARMWQEGVQAVADISNDKWIFSIKEQSPIHYHTFAEVFGLRTTDLNHQEPLLRHPHTTLTPHSTYSLQEGLFRQIAACAQGLLSIHFMESEAEAALYRCEGELYGWYERQGLHCDFLHHSSPAGRLVGSLEKNTPLLLVHNCSLREEDIALLESYFHRPIHWALCPGSNHYISRLKPPVELLRSHRAAICIGTDSLASNHRLSMLDELRRIEGVPLSERLDWATRRGAEALGLADRMGTIEPGKRPGVVLVEGVDLERMELTPESRSRRLV